ncbi:hypothetical protein [Qipengyuania zhejiangensis]|uniref:hypothetical protein n=1 Tax=Qipengyuania zhejiangensis TaxID=3077782 RepID=UPI002D78719A|nr:hypothetical protein [Qipengyuania sp. Z2]
MKFMSLYSPAERPECPPERKVRLKIYLTLNGCGKAKLTKRLGCTWQPGGLPLGEDGTDKEFSNDDFGG